MIRLHAIADPLVMAGLGMSSKNNTAWPFLSYLHEAGRAAGEAWLGEHAGALGRASTLDPAEFAL